MSVVSRIRVAIGLDYPPRYYEAIARFDESRKRLDEVGLMFVQPDDSETPPTTPDPGPGEPIDAQETDPNEPDDGLRGDPDAPQPKNAEIPEDAK